MMNKDENYFLFMGLNELSVPRFLSFSYSNHQCKINLEDDLLEKIDKKEDWFLEEFNYHRSIEDIKKFVLAFERHKNILSEESISKIESKIKDEQINSQRSEIKNFTLLLKVFFKMFDVRQIFIAQFFESEFFEFIVFIFKNIQFYRNVFKNYETNFKNLLVLLFRLEYENLFFQIKDDSFFSKNVKWCFWGLAKRKIDEKLQNIEDNLIFLRNDFWNLFIWIWKFNSTDKKWFSDSLNLLIEKREKIDPEVFIFLLNQIKTKLNDKEIKTSLNFNVNYNALINESEKRLVFHWMKVPINGNNYRSNAMKIILLKFWKSYLQNPGTLMTIFTFPFYNDVTVNQLSSKFGHMIKKDDFTALFESNDYTNSAYSLFIPVIDFAIENIYLPIFINRKEFVFDFFSSIKTELSFIFYNLKVPKNDQQKILFFISKLKKILLKNNWLNDLEITYDIANHSISVIEYLLLITYESEFKRSFNQLPKINFYDKNKTRVNFLIRPVGAECKKSNISNNPFLSVDTLDFIYFNLYSTTNEGGLDFRNRLVHDDWEFSELIRLPIRLMFLTFSIIEEIVLKLLINKK